MKQGRILSFLLTLTMAFAMMPGVAVPAYADDKGAVPAVTLGGEALTAGSSVHFGKYNNSDIQWRVTGVYRHLVVLKDCESPQEQFF